MATTLSHLLFLQWLVVQSVHGVDAEVSRTRPYGLPLLDHYGDCSEERPTLRLHLTHTLPNNPLIYTEVRLYNNTSSTGRDHGGQLETVTDIHVPVIYTQCSQCRDNSLSSSTCSLPKKNMLTGLTVLIRPGDQTTLAQAVIRRPSFVTVVSLMPLTQSYLYTYYTLQGRGGPGHGYSVPTIGIMQAFQNGAVDVNITDLNIALQGETHVYKNKKLVKGDEWTPLVLRDTVWIESEKPSLLKITSTGPLSVFTGWAKSNQSHFSYLTTYGHQMPDTSQWGTVFIADLTTTHILQDLDVSYSILTSNASTVSITTYPNENTMLFQMEKDSLLVKVVNSASLTHLVIKGTQKLLILYEVHRKIANENFTIFSTFLQPIEWYAYKQTAILTTTLQANSTRQPYFITIIAPQDATIHVQTKTTPPVNIAYYSNLTLLQSTQVMDYTIHRVQLHTNGVVSEDMLVLTTSDEKGCPTRLGVTLYAPHLSYAHTNPPPLNDSRTQTVSDDCRRVTDHTPTIVTATSSAVTLLLVLILVAVTIVIVLLMKPRVLFQKPNPPVKDFDYDIFLSFADADKDFVKTLLYLPLRNRGYRVLWHLSDFIAGLSIAENMLTAITHSRWLIFVCSEHFDKSHFCQQELRLGLDNHYSAYKGRYKRVIPLVLGEASCPQKLKQLYPIHVNHSDHTHTNRDIDKLIRKLCLGKTLKALNENKTQRTDRVVTEEMESLLDTPYNTDV